MIDVHFREWKGEQLKFISYTAKVARGLLAHYIIKNKITEVESLKAFNLDGYSYYPELSSDKELYFKNHPMLKHWKGNSQSAIKMFPMLEGREFSSFFGFWKKAEKQLNNLILEDE